MIVSVTKPESQISRMLSEAGVKLLPLAEDHDDVDRYIVSERLAIERRTGSTLKRGIVDKTLFTGALYLKEHFSVPVLIVEGDVDYTYGALGRQAVRGALSSMVVVYGLSLFSTPDPEETAAMIAMMCRQEQVGVAEISLAPKRKAVDLADMQRRVIEMLPGCGLRLARDLLQRFGSIRRIVQATEQELCAVKGIGTKTAGQIHTVLHEEYGAIDTEQDLEDAIETEPSLLFDHPVALLARQHVIFGEEQGRYVIDLVFADQQANELVLVELKRGPLQLEHETQLQAYLDNAPQSPLLRRYLDAGFALRGILATVAQGDYQPGTARQISARVIDRKKAIEVLVGRRQRLRDPN
jgi:Fanconi anemia group M protein